MTGDSATDESLVQVQNAKTAVRLEAESLLVQLPIDPANLDFDNIAKIQNEIE